MIITSSQLKRLVYEKVKSAIREQSEDEVKASQDAQDQATETGNSVKASNATTLSQIQTYMAGTPGIDHTALKLAAEKLQQAQSEIQAAIDSVTAEADEGGKYGFIIDEDDDDLREYHGELE